jgi:hypothetical protein
MLNATTTTDPASAFSLRFSFPFPSHCRSPRSLRSAPLAPSFGREKERDRKNRGRPGEKERVSPSVDPATGFYSRMSIFRQLEPTRRVTKGSGPYSRCHSRARKKKRSGALRLCAFYKRMHSARRRKGAPARTGIAGIRKCPGIAQGPKHFGYIEAR